MRTIQLCTAHCMLHAEHLSSSCMCCTCAALHLCKHSLRTAASDAATLCAGRAHAYYMPASADAAVGEYWRTWHCHAPDGVEYYPDALWEGETTETWPKKRVLDRYSQHTQDCTICLVRISIPQHWCCREHNLAVVARQVTCAMYCQGENARCPRCIVCGA